MAHHEKPQTSAPDADAAVGSETVESLVGVESEVPAAVETDPGFNPALLILMIVVVVLVSIQNLWLRRRAQREQGDDPSD